MIKKITGWLIFFLIVSVGIFFSGCASNPVPKLGQPTLLQIALNKLPSIPMAGNNLDFEFGGDAWVARVGGRNFLTGTLVTQDIGESTFLLLKQTHIFPPASAPSVPGVSLGWISTPGPEIIMEYKAGPPVSFRLVPDSERPAQLGVGASSLAASPAPRGEVSGLTVNREQPVASTARINPRAVLLPFENRAGASYEDDMELLGMLIGDFMNGTRRAVVIHSDSLNAVMTARQWQMTEWASDTLSALMGEALNLHFIIRTVVSRLGTNLIISSRVHDVFSGDVFGTTNVQIQNMDEAFSKMEELSQNLTRIIESSPILRPLLVQEQIEPEISEGIITGQEADWGDTVLADTQIEREQSNDFYYSQPQVNVSAPEKNTRFNTLGLSLGTAFSDPALLISIHGTISPVRNFFIEPGIDFGFASYNKNSYLSQIYNSSGEVVFNDFDGYFSVYPYINAGFFVPFRAKGGFYAGAGVGYMVSKYTFVFGETNVNTFAVNLTAGFNLFDFLDISYTLRTNFSTFNGKITAGFSYRFK
ncbi:MAG: porin family protein [Treponema sp.]|nr:porin family protein [Treponema sp.]